MVNNSQFKIIYGRKSERKDNIIYVREEDFQIPIGEESFGVPIHMLNTIQQKTFEGTPFLKLFSYDEMSLWWFFRSSIFPNYKKIVNFVTRFSEFIDQMKPSVIEINDLNYLSIIQQICKKRTISLKVSRKSLLMFKIKSYIFSHMQKYRYQIITSRKINKRRDFYFRNHDILPNIENKIIFAIPTIFRRLLLNTEIGQSENGEYIQQKIIDLIEEKENIIGIDLDYTFKGEIKTLSERMRDKIYWFPLEALLTKNHDRHNKYANFMKRYINIITTAKFRELFEYKTILLWDNLSEIFSKMTYPPYLPFYLDLYESLVQIFTKHKPRCIFLPYETGPYALAIIMAAKKFKIKTIGIAHAVVDKNNPDYSHDQFTTQNHFGFPLPDVTLLFGNFSMNTLINQGYPQEKFVVFGNPAFFDLDKINTSLSNKQLHLKYEIRSNQKVILLGTQMMQKYYNTHGRYDYDSQIWNYLLQNFGNKDDYLIILKPHPQENIEEYKKILKKYKITNARIIQGDLYELINISSVVISIFSTFMLDSLVLKKPVIRVEFDKISHTIPYDEFGVIVSVDLKNLAKKIHEVLYDSKVCTTLLKNRDIFIKEQFNIPEYNPELVLRRILFNQ
ncbi:MAG: CDP-glycerol glycerophosphotransferase family protein [Nitrososphaeraceae archaeon]